MSKNLDLARECGAAGAWTSKFYENVAVFSLTELDAFAERIRADAKAGAPAPSAERAKIIRELNEDAFDALCRDHDITGTAQARLCRVFWLAGGAKLAARSKP